MTVLVTGATGFLGGALARRLAARGVPSVATGRDAARGALLESAGVPFCAAELPEGAARVFDAAPTVADVVHCAALSSPWGPDDEFERANVQATRALLEEAARRGVRRFVHVSTPAIYFGGRDLQHVREDAPLPPPPNAYVRTKLAAERLVRASGVPHVVLRPRALFGPGDRTILPRIVAALRARRLPVIGSGGNRIDLTYVDNAARACELALAAPDDVLGRAYNVTNGEPVELWPLIRRLARELDLPQPRGRLPRRAADLAAGALEALHRRLRPDVEPRLTRYTVGLLASDTTLDISAAQRDLGYAPEVSMEEGFARAVDALRGELEERP